MKMRCNQIITQGRVTFKEPWILLFSSFILNVLSTTASYDILVRTCTFVLVCTNLTNNVIACYH